MAPPQRCPLCRQTFFCGRGHVYSRKHQRQLKGALERLLPQVEAARKAIRAAQVERYVPEHDRCCWCLCCGCEVRKHLSHGNLTVLHGGLLEHLASPEHKKATNKFWWENKAEVQMKEKFLISPQDYARFKKSMVKSLDSYEEKEDEVIKEMAAQIREVEQSRQEVVRSVLEDTPGVGNIHSGATPPWMIPDEEYSPGNQQIGPSYEEFLKEKEKQKLKKLPPDRVGANFDHSSSTSAGWLPSFGRVWNNGRRWQSRYGSNARTLIHHPFGDITLHNLSYFLSGINLKLKLQ
ncbi:Coiled-coil domain-containing protein 84 [Sciurus carolinensis]|uniref:Coiled-coil domain-containing protein 84 n=1 Tax=Sciurus carolinensis TaxID=30640 RepID=A0AA41MS17_SCICA|nr:Coiled-coil domain-containing protein 84 [Sciurus carolinensis]